MAIIIHRVSETCRMRGRSRSAHYKDIQDGLFPRPVKIGLRAVGHPDDELNAMNAARIAELSEDEIRALVVKLEAARKAAV
jgi:prophage regulatory protein